jgi:3-deoxy-D-manno-octulosonic-acid transferase
VEVGAAVMAPDATALEEEIANLVGDAALRERMGIAARALVRRQQGATGRTLAAIESITGPIKTRHRAA